MTHPELGPAASQDRPTGAPEERKSRRAPSSWVFWAWVGAFYIGWFVFVSRSGLWPEVKAHYPIAVAMAGGSFVAGSSPVAGGTVGFPVIVYVFNHPARLGRDFSLAIQSIGMVSASLYILTSGRQIEWRVLRFALLGSACFMPIGMVWIAPFVADSAVKLLFGVVYASFGLLHFFRLREIIANQGPSATYLRADPIVGFTVGALGGVLSSIIGVGADILLYGALVLLYHTDVRIAIPTSVVLMAFTSLVGSACKILLGNTMGDGLAQPVEVLPYWVAAAPVVVLGAPLGSFVSRFVSRRTVLLFVAVLCLVQYAWTCHREQIGGWKQVVSILGVLALNFVLHALFRFGQRLLPLRD